MREKMKKLVQELGKVFEGITVLCILINEDSEIFFEAGSDGACSRNTTDNQSSFGMTDEGPNYAKSWGVGNVYNVFDTTPTSQKQNINIHQSNWINEVNINSVQIFTDFGRWY